MRLKTTLCLNLPCQPPKQTIYTIYTSNYREKVQFVKIMVACLRASRQYHSSASDIDAMGRRFASPLAVAQRHFATAALSLLQDLEVCMIYEGMET